MGFVNVKLTEEERVEFENKNIRSPRTGLALKPTHVTIDYDNNNLLTHFYNDRESREAEENIMTYLFIYEDIPCVLKVITVDCGNKKTNWLIKSIEYPLNTGINKADLKEQITHAFESYKATGWPRESNEKTSATCTFAEGV